MAQKTHIKDKRGLLMLMRWKQPIVQKSVGIAVVAQLDRDNQKKPMMEDVVDKGNDLELAKSFV